MSRPLVQRLTSRAPWLAVGLVGLAAGTAAGSVRLVVSHELRAIEVVEIGRPDPSPGATITVVTVGEEIEVVAEASPGRQIVFPVDPVLASDLDPAPTFVRPPFGPGKVPFSCAWLRGDPVAVCDPLLPHLGPQLLFPPDTGIGEETLRFLFWSRFCSRVALRGCVDPSMVGLAPPSFGIGLDVDRLRIKTRKRGAKIRAHGSLDLGGLPLPEHGSFSISVGAFFASIALEDFERRGSLRVWRGRGRGLRRVVLHDSGAFRVLARRVDPELLEGDLPAVFVQLGAGLAAIRVPLD